METLLIKIEKPQDMNMILGQSHFIKTVEDLHEVLATSAPALSFGIAFCESSGPRLIRSSGNNENLTRLAEANALELGAGHAFIILMDGGFPINVLNAVKQVQEVCGIYCATANPVEVVIAVTGQGRGILGVIDGGASTGIESEADVTERKELLRNIGYKM